MMDTLTVSGLAVVTAPASLLGVLGVTGLAGRPLGERTVGAAMRLALGVAGVALPAIAAAELHGSGRPILVDGGTWFSAPGYRFEVRLLFDRLSIAFAALTIGLGGAVGVFAERYLHREPGYHRFFLLLALFISSGSADHARAATIELSCTPAGSSWV